MSQVKCSVKDQVVEVSVDGELRFTLDRIFFKRSLRALEKAQDLEALIAQVEVEGAWNYALRALNRKGYFCYELKGKLKQRHVSDAGIEAVVQKLLHYGYLDDARELEVVIRRGLAQGRGPRRLLMDLKRRSGLEMDVLERAIGRGMPEEACVEQGRALVNKRYVFPRDRNKAYGFLARRGFGLDVIQKILQQDA